MTLIIGKLDFVVGGLAVIMLLFCLFLIWQSVVVYNDAVTLYKECKEPLGIAIKNVSYYYGG